MKGFYQGAEMLFVHRIGYPKEKLEIHKQLREREKEIKSDDGSFCRSNDQTNSRLGSNAKRSLSKVNSRKKN